MSKMLERQLEDTQQFLTLSPENIFFRVLRERTVYDKVKVSLLTFL